MKYWVLETNFNINAIIIVKYQMVEVEGNIVWYKNQIWTFLLQWGCFTVKYLQVWVVSIIQGYITQKVQIKGASLQGAALKLVFKYWNYSIINFKSVPKYSAWKQLTSNDFYNQVNENPP